MQSNITLRVNASLSLLLDIVDCRPKGVAKFSRPERNVETAQGLYK